MSVINGETFANFKSCDATEVDPNSVEIAEVKIFSLINNLLTIETYSNIVENRRGIVRKRI